MSISAIELVTECYVERPFKAFKVSFPDNPGPFNILVVPWLYGTLIVLKPSAMYNPFSVLSPSWQTRPVLIVIATIEGFFMMHFVLMTYFLVMLVLLFFQKCIEDTTEALRYSAEMCVISKIIVWSWLQCFPK